MGRRLCVQLASQGHRVRALCLPGDPATASLRAGGIDVIEGDVTRPGTLPPAVAGAGTVYHLAALLLSPLRPEAFHAVNAEGTANLVRACESAGVTHFILVSSISVTYPWSNAYSRSKALAEEIVRASRLPFTIVRPTLAYEDGGAAEFMRFVAHLKRAPVVLLPRGGRARKRPVHVEDLVAGFTALAGNPAALGKTYVFAGGEALSLRDMADLLLAHMGRRKPVLGFPLWAGFMLAVAARLWAMATGRESAVTVQSLTGLIQDAAPEDDGGAAADLGWRPRSFSQGLMSLHGLKDCLSRRGAPAGPESRVGTGFWQ